MSKQTGKAILFEGAGNPLVEKDLPLPEELEPGAAAQPLPINRPAARVLSQVRAVAVEAA